MLMQLTPEDGAIVLRAAVGLGALLVVTVELLDSLFDDWWQRRRRNRR